MKRTLTVAVVALVLSLTACVEETPAVGGDTGEEIISGSSNEENPPEADVTLDGCEPGEFGTVTVPLTITNHSSKASNYLITVEILDADGTRLGEAFTAADAVRPDQTSKTEAIGTVTDGDVDSCKLLQVERFSAEG